MTETIENIRPFLRWAGGKQWLLSDLSKYLPNIINNYHEPFLGGGAIFVYLKTNGLISGKSFLSDLNDDLINAYVTIRDDLPSLTKKLKQFENTEKEYYNVRKKQLRSSISRAAQFIFLNRTSFNGIYRVNLDGQYNVPYGNKKYLTLFDYENFKNLSNYFYDCEFRSVDFFETIDNIKGGDLVFLDPPYTVAHEHNGFVKYNQKIFEWKDQIRLREYIEILKERKVNIILTNAAHQSIEDLYRNIGKRFKVSRFSVIGGLKAKRKKYNELVFVA
ncbi:MAG: Dam family site-specific DNA-(adenine-N6)-methyltransferase [Cyclobacteriaceae bacterium]